MNVPEADFSVQFQLSPIYKAIWLKNYVYMLKFLLLPLSDYWYKNILNTPSA